MFGSVMCIIDYQWMCISTRRADALAKEPKFSGRFTPADIFYIVKRGST
jgi:hypothetical protein